MTWLPPMYPQDPQSYAASIGKRGQHVIRLLCRMLYTAAERYSGETAVCCNLPVMRNGSQFRARSSCPDLHVGALQLAQELVTLHTIHFAQSVFHP